MLHLAEGEAHPRVLIGPVREALARLGQLEVVAHAGKLSVSERAERCRLADVVITGWGAASLPAELGKDPGRLGYVCHFTGEMRKVIPIEIIQSPIAVTNWGDSPSFGVAEGAMALLLAGLKDLHHQILHQRQGRSPVDPRWGICGLRDLQVGIFGLGVIGRKFLDMLSPFEAKVRVFDPYLTQCPAGVERVTSLADLARGTEALVIHAGQTPETIGCINGDILDLLAPGALVVNTARPLIIRQDDLFARVAEGRLRAALDVVDGDQLPPGHPIRACDRFIWTGHRISSEWPDNGEPILKMSAFHRLGLENIGRFSRGEALLHPMDETRYLRST